MSDKEWLTLAARQASHSPDPSTQVGAVVVSPTGDTISRGCNTFPRAVQSLPHRLERPDKYSYIEHAERNAIYEAARMGTSLYGATMYANWAACADCARAIIQAGIKRVVTLKSYRDNPSDRWDLSVPDEMLAEAGVRLDVIDHTCGVQLLFNGKLVRV